MNREVFDLSKISLRGLCMDLLRHLWMILLSGATLWLAATGWHNLTYEPAYTASATLVVGVKGEANAYSSLSVASQMATVFGEVFQSDALRNKIAEDTGEKIEGTISCSAIEETNLLVLSTTSPNPRQAYLFIHSALENYEEVAGDVFANSYLEIVQEPEVPEAPSNTSWAMRCRYLLVLLAMAGMAGVTALFYILRFTVKNPAAAAEDLDGEIRGVIPFEKKNGGLKAGEKKEKKKQSLVLNSPLVTMDFAEASRRTAAKIEHHLRRRHLKSILVVSVAENEGKSTVAANLALALAEKHKKVLLVDGDLRKPAQHKVFAEPKQGRISLEKVLKGQENVKEAIYYSKRNHLWQLFQFTGVENPAALMDAGRFAGLLKEAGQEMDYVIVDCSPSAVSTDAEVWMGAVDSALLVVREDWTDVRVINDTVDVIWQSGKDFAGFVLNAFHREWFQTMHSPGYDTYGYGSYGKGVKSTEERGS